MQMTDQKTKNEVRVVYADYDHKTRISALKFGNATISKDGTAQRLPYKRSEGYP